MHYIIEFTLEDNFKVHGIAKGSEKEARSKINNMIRAIQLSADVKIHPALKMINKNTTIKIEQWNVQINRFTTNANKKFLIYFYNGRVSSTIETAKGIKTAYLNIQSRVEQFNMSSGSRVINMADTIIIIEGNQQATLKSNRGTPNSNSKEIECENNDINTSKLLNGFEKITKGYRRMGSSLNILVMKYDSLYIVYTSDNKYKIKVIAEGHNNIEEIQRAVCKRKLMPKGIIDVDMIVVSRDFVDDTLSKYDGDSMQRIYDLIKGSLVVGIDKATSIGKEIKDSNIVKAIFLKQDGGQEISRNYWGSIIRNQSVKPAIKIFRKNQ